MALGVLGVTVARRPRPRPRPARQVTVNYTPKVTFPAAANSFVACPTPGVLDVHAKFDLDNKPTGRRHLCMPFLLVRRLIGAGPNLETVWQQDYEARTFELKPGSHLTPDFRQRLEMPANSYLVTVGYKDVAWQLDEDGEPYLDEVQPVPLMHSAWHVVK